VSRLIAIALSAILGGSVALAGPAHSTARTSTRPVIRGADVSWPNCPKGEGIPSRRSEGAPMPAPGTRFVIVGLTNGPGFHPNPCIAREVRWVQRRHLRLGAYALTTYPPAAKIRRYGERGPFSGNGVRAALRNTGYAEARYNLATMARIGMSVPMIWVDVEPYPVAPWSASHRHNRAIVVGAVRAYRDAGFTVGIYTNPNGWGEVVGDWQLPQLPTWSTVGSRGATAARRSCSRGPSGGPTWLAQWWVGRRDLDLTCPLAPARSVMFRRTG
jgi:hypothetical protein